MAEFKSEKYDKSLEYGLSDFRNPFIFSRGSNQYIRSSNRKGYPLLATGEMSPEQRPTLILKFQTSGSLAPISGKHLTSTLLEAKVGYSQVSENLCSIMRGPNDAVYVVMDRSVTWTEENPLRLRIRVSSEDYITSYQQYVLYERLQYTDNVLMTHMEVPPPGCSTLYKRFYQGAGGLHNNLSLTFAATVEKPETTTFSIPVGTKFYDIDGNEITGNLTIRGAQFSSMEPSSAAALPGGFFITDFIDENGVRNTLDNFVVFSSGGFMSLEISDNNGNHVASLSNDMTVAMELNPDNPFNFQERTIEDGDTVPLWSISKDGKWKLEANELTIIDNTVTFTTQHLSIYNLDWKRPVCDGSQPRCIMLSNNSAVMKMWEKCPSLKMSVIVTSAALDFGGRSFGIGSMTNSEGEKNNKICFWNVPVEGIDVSFVPQSSVVLDTGSCTYVSPHIIATYHLSCQGSPSGSEMSDSQIAAINCEDLEPELDPLDQDTTLGCCKITATNGEVLFEGQASRSLCKFIKCTSLVETTMQFNADSVCPGLGCCTVISSFNDGTTVRQNVTRREGFTPEQCQSINISGMSTSTFTIGACPTSSPEPSPEPSPS